MKLYMRISDGLFPCYQNMVDEYGEEKFKEVIDKTEAYDYKIASPGKWNKPWTDENGVLISSQVIVSHTKHEIDERAAAAWASVRRKRDVELEAMDKFKQPWHPKHPANDKDTTKLDNYMQALRDLPDNTDDPDNVVFPERPEFL